MSDSDDIELLDVVQNDDISYEGKLMNNFIYFILSYK